MSSKGLEALKEIITNKIVIRPAVRPQMIIAIPQLYEKQIDTIKKELKALEIIIEKKVDADVLYQSHDYRVYNEKTRNYYDYSYS